MNYHIYEITYISNSVVVHSEIIIAVDIPAAIDELEQTAVIDYLLGIIEDDLPAILREQNL